MFAVFAVSVSVPLADLLRVPRGHRLLGWVLVAVPLPVALAIHLAVVEPRLVDQAVFLLAVAAFVVGAILLAASDEPPEHDWSNDDPPWWPEFERAFAAHVRRRPVARR